MCSVVRLPLTPLPELKQRLPTVSERLSLHAGALASHRLREVGAYVRDPQYRKLQLEAWASWDAWGRRLTERIGDLRLELRGYYRDEDTDLYNNTSKAAEVGLVFRSSWGLFRFSYRGVWESPRMISDLTYTH